MIEGVHITAANERDAKSLDVILMKVPAARKQEVWADEV